MRLGEAYERWLDAKKAEVEPSTWIDYESICRIYLEPHRRLSLRKTAVQGHNIIVESVRPGRRLRVRTVLRMVLAFHGYTLQAPATSRRSRRVARVHAVPTRDHVAALAAACGVHEPLVWVAATSGLRWGELLALEPADVQGDTIEVTKAWCGKTHQAKAPKSPSSIRRVIVLPEGIPYLEAIPFRSPRGKHLNHANFNHQFWKPALQATGLNWRFHDLRHFYATTLLERGVPIHQVSRMLGHSQASVTLDIYAGFMDDGLNDIRRRLR